MSYIYNINHWYGDHSDRVTSELVSISVIKSIHVLFGTIDGKSMGISESCRPLKLFLELIFNFEFHDFLKCRGSSVGRTPD